MTSYIKAEPSENNTVIYTDSDNNRFEYSGGTRAWRNSNPGNLRPSRNSEMYGQIGIADNFSIFSSFEAAHTALSALLEKEYGYMNISQMIKDYAPRTENNTENYEEYLYKQTGVAKQKLIIYFTDTEFDKLLKAIQQMEGWEAGTITKL